MHIFLKVAPYLLLLVPVLTFLILSGRFPDEADYLYWKIAFIFHMPLILFFSITVLVGTVSWYERKHRRVIGKK